MADRLMRFRKLEAPRRASIRRAFLLLTQMRDDGRELEQQDYRETRNYPPLHHFEILAAVADGTGVIELYARGMDARY